jgi:CubicO group peptidase (beta-lactamase class C family)
MRLLTPLVALALLACQGGQSRMPPPPPPPSGVAYAWVTFDANRVRTSGASGLADRAQGRALTIEDPVRIASISKLVVALGVMRLAEQGRIDLDADVSRHLGWELRNPAFPDRPITLRLLLSHRSSIRDEGDNYVIPLSGSVREMTAGRPASFDPNHSPGTFFRYSNLNFPVIASVLERATGQRFDRLMDAAVLKPLGLDACFNWSTCSDARIPRAVVLYNPDGSVRLDDLRGQRPACPVNAKGPDCDLSRYPLGSNGALFSPQGGLRASASDLARIGQLLLNKGRFGGRPFLSEASIETILTPVWTFNGSNGDTEEGFYCSYGLAAQMLPVAASGCSDDLFGGGRRMVGHAGEAYGLRSGLWVDRARQVGIAYFATGNGPTPPAGRTAYRGVEEWLAAKLKD